MRKFLEFFKSRAIALTITLAIIFLPLLASSFIFYSKNKNKVENNPALLQSAENHFSLVRNRKGGEQNEDDKLAKKVFLIGGEEIYRKMLAVFQADDFPKISVYINPADVDAQEEFKYAAGFEKLGSVYIKKEISEDDISDPLFSDPAGVFKHELIHVFVYYILEKKTDVPSWFNEGIAQYYSGTAGELEAKLLRILEKGIEKLILGGSIYKGYAAQTTPDQFFKLDAGSELRKGEEEGWRFYDISLDLIQTLVKQKGGEEKLRELLLTIKRGNSLEKSFEIVYDMTPIDLWNLWLADN